MIVSKSLLTHLSLIFCNVIWACDYPFYSLVLGKYITPMAMISASLVVAALWSLVPLLWEKPERIESRDMLKIVGAALLMGIARKLCMMYGLAHTSAVDGSIISTTTPLMVLLLSAFMGIERITRIKTLGLLLGMAGTVAVIISSQSGVHEQSGMSGNVLIFISACVSAAYMVWFKKLLSKYRITTLLRWTYCLSAIVMLPFGTHDILMTEVATMSTKIVLASLFVLILPTYLPNLLLNYSLKVVTPTVTSVYAYIQPVVAIALAVAMGLDKLHLNTVLFAAVIFIGVWIVIGSSNKEPISAHYR